MDLDVEGLQGPSDTYNSKLVNEQMHDVHVEVGVGQGHDPQHVQELVVVSIGEGGVDCFIKAVTLEAYATVGHDQYKVIP